MTQEFSKTPMIGQPGKIRPLSSSPLHALVILFAVTVGTETPDMCL